MRSGRNNNWGINFSLKLPLFKEENGLNVCTLDLLFNKILFIYSTKLFCRKH